MFIFIGEVLEGILSFFADLWLVRKVRAQNQRPENSWQKDAADLAYVEWWLTAVATGVAVLGFVLLFYVFGLSFGVSFFFTAAPAGLYCGYRWWKLARA